MFVQLFQEANGRVSSCFRRLMAVFVQLFQEANGRVSSCFRKLMAVFLAVSGS